MERGLNCANGISKTKRILDQFIEKLRRSNQSNGHGQRNNEETILKKLDQKRYRSFKVLKVIGQGAFWLKLPEG